MNVPYGKVDWAEDIISPFKKETTTNDANLDRSTKIRAPAHDIFESQNAVLDLDEGNHESKRTLKCIIVGKSKKDQSSDQPICYVLLVEESQVRKPGVYERVGVAQLPESQIDFTTSSSVVDIQ